MSSMQTICRCRSLVLHESVRMHGKETQIHIFDFECTQNDVLCCAEGYAMNKNPECVQCNNNNDPCLECALCINCQQSWCEKFQHRPNLVVAQKVCEKCIDQVFIPGSRCDNCGTRCRKCDLTRKKKRLLTFHAKTHAGFAKLCFRGTIQQTILDHGCSTKRTKILRSLHII